MERDQWGAVGGRGQVDTAVGLAGWTLQSERHAEATRDSSDSNGEYQSMCIGLQCLACDCDVIEQRQMAGGP